jgi:hypothetical protein
MSSEENPIDYLINLLDGEDKKIIRKSRYTIQIYNLSGNDEKDCCVFLSIVLDGEWVSNEGYTLNGKGLVGMFYKGERVIDFDTRGNDWRYRALKKIVNFVKKNLEK